MLSKYERLSKDQDIRKTIKSKQYTGRTPLLYLIARENHLDKTRIVVVTPKKLGKAVLRNRIRRIFVEGYSKIRDKIAKKVDIAIFPNQLSAGCKAQEIAASLKEALIKCRVCT